MSHSPSRSKYPIFDRNFFNGEEPFTVIGTGAIGGKATGLYILKDKVLSQFPPEKFYKINLDIPRLTVIASDYFDRFMAMNNLHEIAYSDMTDERIAHHFQKTDLPPSILGDLQALIEKVHQPLAVRSSSLLEDAMFEPFAGIYGTKMIPNNQPDSETRFRKLVEAIKFVYASTYFSEAKNYIGATRHSIRDEKMCVIIQEVVGLNHGERFYPDISGVGRSYNFYPTGRAKPEQGVVDIALGLGKSIVDGGSCWTYSPAFPRAKPPYGSTKEFLKFTQNRFWSINMGKPPAYDPSKETEYLVQNGLDTADYDNVLRHLVSTYNAASDRIDLGYEGSGPKLLTFAPLLDLEIIPINKCIKELLQVCEEIIGEKVEIEFAVTLDQNLKKPARFGLLQARPMVVSHEEVNLEFDEMQGVHVLTASENVMGNGIIDDLIDIVYVKPDVFDAKNTPVIAQELERINQNMLKQNRKYLLIGFGRWGSSDHWLGIPVNWGQISRARVMVEATLPNMYVDLSQGSHFFHNITSFQVGYFSVRHSGPYGIDWNWLDRQNVIEEMPYTRHVRVKSPLTVKLDGKNGRGVIRHG